MGNKQGNGYVMGDRSVSWEPDHRSRTDLHANTLPIPITPGHYAPRPPFPGAPMPMYRPAGIPTASRPSADGNGSVIRDGVMDDIQKLDSDGETKKVNSESSKASRPGTNDSGYLTAPGGSSGRKKPQPPRPDSLPREPIYGHYMPPNHPMFMGPPRPPGPLTPGSFMMPPGPPFLNGYPPPPHMMPPYPVAPVSPDGRKRRGWKKKQHKLSKSQIQLYHPDPSFRPGGPPFPAHLRMMHPHLAQGQMMRAQSFDDIMTPGLRHLHPHPQHNRQQSVDQKDHKAGPGSSKTASGKLARRPSPEGEEKGDRKDEFESSSDTSKVVKAELHHSADNSKPKKSREAIYETLKQGRLNISTTNDNFGAKISPEAQAIMERNASILDQNQVTNVPTTAPRKIESKIDVKIQPGVVEPKILPVLKTKTQPAEGKNRDFVDKTLMPCPPKRQRHKSKGLFPAHEAWDLLNVSEEVQRRRIGPKTPEETVVEDMIVPDIVPSPPSRRQTVEPIYLEYDDRLLPEFKKRLIETGSFDLPEKYSDGSFHRPQKTSRNGSENLPPVSGTDSGSIPQPKKGWKGFSGQDKAYYPAHNEMRKFQSTEEIEQSTKGSDEKPGIKNQLKNVFRRTRSSDKILEPKTEAAHEEGEANDEKRGENSVIDFSWVDDLENKFQTSQVDQELLREQAEQMRKHENIDVYGTILKESRVRNAVTIPLTQDPEPEIPRDAENQDGHSTQIPSREQTSPRNIYKQFEKDVGADAGFSQDYGRRQILPNGIAHDKQPQSSPGFSRNEVHHQEYRNDQVRDMTSREAISQQNMPPSPQVGNRIFPSDRMPEPVVRPSPTGHPVRHVEQNRNYLNESMPAREDRKVFENGGGHMTGNSLETSSNHQRHLNNFDAPIYKQYRVRSMSNLHEPIMRSAGPPRSPIPNGKPFSTENVISSKSMQRNVADRPVYIPAPDYDTADIPQFESIYGTARHPQNPRSPRLNPHMSRMSPGSRNRQNSPKIRPGEMPVPRTRTYSEKMPSPGYAFRHPASDRRYDSTEFYRNNILGERNRQLSENMQKHGSENYQYYH